MLMFRQGSHEIVAVNNLSLILVASKKLSYINK